MGNELGYVVGMAAQRFDPPKAIQPGHRVRIEAMYDAAQPYAGIMSVLNVVFTNFSVQGCVIDYASFIQVG